MAKADYGHRYADEELARMERKLKSVYGNAKKDMAQSLDKFTAGFQKRDEEYRRRLESGEISKEEYEYWLRGQVFTGELWDEKKAEMAEIMLSANKEASDIVNGGLINVFAENANFAAYQIEHDFGANFGFSLLDKNTVTRLLKEDPDLLTQYKPKATIDKAWNRRAMSRQVTQGIISGESIPKIANRLAVVTGARNMSSMMMHARTSVTNAQNAGRLESYRKAEEMGIKLKKQWVATMDDRTRDQHAALDGQKVEIDEPFTVDGLEIMYPADPEAEPALVYNCRCTMIADLIDYPDHYSGNKLNGEDVGEIEYEDWKEGKEAKTDAQLEKLGVPRKEWASRDEMLAAANPNYDKSKLYHTNCANCAVAHDIQMRGYDVEALPRDYKANIAKFWFDGRTGMGSWTDCYDGGIKPDLIEAKRKTQVAGKIQEKMAEYGDGSRAVVHVKWDSGGGHYFNVDYVGGNVLFSDSQNCAQGERVLEYFDRAKPTQVRLLRTDDKSMTGFVKEVVGWKEK